MMKAIRMTRKQKSAIYDACAESFSILDVRIADTSPAATLESRGMENRKSTYLLNNYLTRLLVDVDPSFYFRSYGCLKGLGCVV